MHIRRFNQRTAMRTVVANATFCSFVMLLGGCANEVGVPTFPVTGTVTQKGKPVEGAIVAFTPSTPGPSASGVTDASGVYKLTTRSNGDGAAAGKYMITICKYDKKPPAKKQPEPDKETDPADITNEYPEGYNEMQAAEIAAIVSKNLLPPKYAQTATSKLEAEVKQASENKFDFSVD